MRGMIQRASLTRQSHRSRPLRRPWRCSRSTRRILETYCCAISIWPSAWLMFAGPAVGAASRLNIALLPHGGDPLFEGHRALRQKHRLLARYVDLAWNVVVTLIMSGAATNSELNNGLPIVFDYGELMLPSRTDGGIELASDRLGVVPCKHSRFASGTPAELPTVSSARGQAPPMARTLNTRTCQQGGS